MIGPDGERLDQIQKALRVSDWDALVLFHTDNILMAAGVFPGSTHVVAIVTADKKVVVITPWWRERFVEDESWADDILTYDWCKGFNGVEPVSAITHLLRKCKSSLSLEQIGNGGNGFHSV